MATKRKSVHLNPKSLPIGARTGVLLDQTSLLAHTSRFASGPSSALLASQVREYVKFYDKQLKDRENPTPPAYGHYPPRGRGAPRKDEYTVLVSSLATALALATNKPSTQNYDGDQASTFEAFADPILTDLGIFNVKGLVKKHIQLRKKLSRIPEDPASGDPTPGAPPAF